MNEPEMPGSVAPPDPAVGAGAPRGAPVAAGAAPPATRAPPRLVLLGGGHAHVHVLRVLAERPLEGAAVTLVAPSPVLVYSGMVPGVVAGRFGPDDCTIDLVALARRAGIAFEHAAATAIDAAAREVTIERDDGTAARLGYDVLGVDVGGAVDRASIAGAARHALFIRPMPAFVAAIERHLADASRCREAAVIGGGAGGVELAFALRRRLGSGARVALVAGAALLAGAAPALRKRARRALLKRGVAIVEDDAVAVEADAVVLRSGVRVPSALSIVATGSAAPAWLAGSGLALDARGFIATGATLQSVSHAEVLAAGDVASRVDAARPRSGVYAVKAGALLAANLRAALDGASLAAYRPQQRSLNLLACGDGTAIASWGRWALEGRVFGRLKDRIDRRFVERHRVA